MDRILYTVGIILLSLNVFSQVGVNTDTPKTTLDVSANRDETGQIIDNNQLLGLQAPRLTRQELFDNTAVYGSDQKGALIYITDISGGQANGQLININEADHYYYFDGGFWQKITDINIYKDNGTLTSNRIVNQQDKTMSFTSTATSGTSHFTVDGSTLNVDAVNDRIGINNDTPTAKLDVIGNSTTPPVRARNMESSATTTLSVKPKLSPVLADQNGVLVRQFSVADPSDSYYFDGPNVLVSNGAPVDIVTGIGQGTIVKFSFLTNFSFGNSNSAIIYAEVSFSQRKGFRVNDNWTHSGNTFVTDIALNGVGTHTLTFGDSFGTLTLNYDSGKITASKTNGPNTNIQILEGLKMRN